MTTAASIAAWRPDSWRERVALQQPRWADERSLQRVIAEIAGLPPLVTSWEIEQLKSQLALAARGERFLLQGGDCAERFDECSPDAITSKLTILLQMRLVLLHSSKKRVIRVGRFAGQYAKPRSQDNEVRDGVVLPAYRGDIVNAADWDPAGRRPDPRRMVEGYQRAAMTLNFVRGLIDGGFADLHHPEYWDLAFFAHSPRAARYHRMVESIGDSLRFMEAVADAPINEINRVDFFTSHEALLLPYEQAQTRQVPRRRGWYNLTTHLPWLGLRTTQLEGAHVEYLRGIDNPIGVKVGPSLSPGDLVALADRLDPEREPGRLTLIHRFGVGRIEHDLPPLIAAMAAEGRNPLWCCDPMHGNTQTTSDGVKTRTFDDILGELERAFEVHERCGSWLGGVHFELTGENVTECVGGARGLAEVDLQRAYRSQVDPRLNYEQALEMALLVGERMARRVAGSG